MLLLNWLLVRSSHQSVLLVGNIRWSLFSRLWCNYYSLVATEGIYSFKSKHISNASCCGCGSQHPVGRDSNELSGLCGWNYALIDGDDGETMDFEAIDLNANHLTVLLGTRLRRQLSHSQLKTSEIQFRTLYLPPSSIGPGNKL